MAHIFISYSHQDKAYVSRLYEALRAHGFDAWIDDRIDYGTDWPKEIQRRLDACEALVLVMTPRAYESEWVHNELSRAQRLRKPVLPLLLEGDPWLSVESKQYVDVRGGRLPPETFYERLKTIAPGSSSKARRTKQVTAGLSRLFPKNALLGRVGWIVIATGLIITGVLLFPKLSALVDDSASSTPTFATDGRPEAGQMTGTPTVTTALSPEPALTSTMTPTSEPILIVSPFAGMQRTRERDGMVEIFIPSNGTTILDDFWIDRTEVTNAMYRTCVLAGQCGPPSDQTYYSFDDYPVVGVDWYAASTYCAWIGGALPSEIQWQVAAGSEQTYPWGEAEPDCTRANYASCLGGPASVGQYPTGSSRYGLLDMAGNVWEWTTSQTSAGNKVLHGGDWRSVTYFLRIRNRSEYSPQRSSTGIGFRCVRYAVP